MQKLLLNTFWVLRNNCNGYLVFLFPFLVKFDCPNICRSLKLWNEVPSNKFQTSLAQK